MGNSATGCSSARRKRHGELSSHRAIPSRVQGLLQRTGVTTPVPTLPQQLVSGNKGTSVSRTTVAGAMVALHSKTFSLLSRGDCLPCFLAGRGSLRRLPGSALLAVAELGCRGLRTTGNGRPPIWQEEASFSYITHLRRRRRESYTPWLRERHGGKDPRLTQPYPYVCGADALISSSCISGASCLLRSSATITSNHKFRQ
jgi:hypothetical protein